MVLGIFGAGGLGREFLETAQIIDKKEKKFEEIIFIDDNRTLDTVQNKKIYCLNDAVKKYGRRLKIVLAIGEPFTRVNIIDRVKKLGVEFITLIHPSVHISDTTMLGEGCYIGAFSFISCNVNIGDYCLMQPHSAVGHNCIIENNVIISSMCALSGNVTVGENTYVGVNTSVIQGVSIGSNSILGMGSVVMRDIPEEVIAMGNPARVIKKNENHTVFA